MDAALPLLLLLSCTWGLERDNAGSKGEKEEKEVRIGGWRGVASPIPSSMAAKRGAKVRDLPNVKYELLFYFLRKYISKC